jgi:hypothetical protein
MSRVQLDDNPPKGNMMTFDAYTNANTNNSQNNFNSNQ